MGTRRLRPLEGPREDDEGRVALQVASVKDLPPFVLFLDGRPREKRHLNNIEELIPKLRDTFPGMQLLFPVQCALTMRMGG